MSDANEERPERLNPAGMARSLGMSRTRLYQLMDDGIFPKPSRDEEDRPFFTREQQEQIHKAYQSNRGINGRSCFFRPKATQLGRPARRPTKSAPKQDHSALLEAVRVLGLRQVKKADLERCLGSLYPDGKLPDDKPQLAKQVFLHLVDRATDQKQQGR
jgi:hypothetical protein